MESNESPQLTGVVIITLPSPDDPSKAKTITAFTLTDTPSRPSLQPSHQAPSQNPQPPTQPSPRDELHFSLRGGRIGLLGSPRAGFSLLGVSLIALMLWFSVPQKTLYKLKNLEDDDKVNSFVLPLYPKLGTSRRDVELKLGRFVDFDPDNVVVPLNDEVRLRKKIKYVSAASAIDSTTILPVKGNIYSYGLYYTYILVGSPPRPYFLDMDTGSDLTWIQCDAPCASCAKGRHPFYKPTEGNIIPLKDSLCTEVQRTQRPGNCETCHQCDYEIEYADQSSSMGVLVRDELHLKIANGSLAKLKVVFGCAYDQQGLLLNSLAKTDGILGLSGAKVSLPSQLASQGLINNVLGHCLTSDAGGGGYMFLGDDFVPYWKMSWVPMLRSPSTNFYEAEVVRMNYGSKQLSLHGLNNGLERAVFDSGSSYTYFTKQAYSQLVSSLIDISGEDLIQDASDPALPICWRAKSPLRSVSDVKHFFKPLSFQFRSKWWIVSTRLLIPPEGYLIISDKGNVCLGILDGSEVHNGSTTIIGDISLRGVLIVYDNVNHKIGWVQSDCVKPQRFKTTSFLQA